jgi:hypothetical protein
MVSTKSLIILTLITAPLYAQRQPGSPLDALPKNVELITHFGACLPGTRLTGSYLGDGAGG